MDDLKRKIIIVIYKTIGPAMLLCSLMLLAGTLAFLFGAQSGPLITAWVITNFIAAIVLFAAFGGLNIMQKS